MNVSRTLGALVILVVILGAWLFAMSGSVQAAVEAPMAQPASSDDQITLIESDANGIVVSIQLDNLTFEHRTANNTTYDLVSLPDFESSALPGNPQVPTRRLLLGIPLDADYALRVSVQESETISGPYKLLPAPMPILQPDPDSPIGIGAPGSGWEYVEDERAYAEDALVPDAIAKVSSAGFIRDQRFIAVEVNPVQYNPVSGNVVWHKRFTVEIDFTYQRGAELGAARQPEPSFEPLLSASLLNYASAAKWRGRPSRAVPTTSLDVAALDAESPIYKIMVNEDGIYQVTAADLVAAGVPVSTIPTATYKLSYRGREVPIHVLESDGTFASLWFYGEQSRTKYTDTNVYWLTYDTSPPPGAEPGLRMPSTSVPPTTTVPVSAYYSDTIRLEEDLLYRPYMPWAGGLPSDPWDHWFWDFTRYYRLDPGNPDNKPVLQFPTHIGSLSTAPYSSTLTAFMSGLTRSTTADPDHCTEFFINGVSVGQYLWDGRYTDELASFVFDSSVLLDGANVVEAHFCATDALSDVTYHDWLELDVRRLYQAEDDSLRFDVAEAGWQYRLDGFSAETLEVFDISGTYTVSHLVDVVVTPQGTQYSAAFYDAKADLGTRFLALTHNRLKSPLAIEAYSPANLADPANQADYIVIAPQEFVPGVQPLVAHRTGQGLIVKGVELGAIFDEFNYGIYSPEAIRDFLAYAYDNWSGEPPAYVLLVGDGSFDYKGNLSQGNPNLLPPYLAFVDPWFGETAADNRYVTVAGDDPLADMHIGRLPAENTTHLQTMVAKTIAYETNPAPKDWVERVLFVTDDPDLAGDFYSYSDSLVNDYLPAPYVPIKAYYKSTCLTGATCKQVILDTLNTTGALFVNYIGHAGITQWTGTESVWTIDDLSSLVPISRLPVMLPMTCFEGAYHWADIDALAEAIVRIDGKGAVASWSATGEGVAAGHDYLNKGFLQSVLSDGVRRLGVATDIGKAWLFNAGFSEDLLETYHVLGDPALLINPLVDVAVGQSIYAPVDPVPGSTIRITLTFTNTGPGVESAVTLTDQIPAVLVNPAVTYSSTADIALQPGTTFVWTIDNLQPGASGEIFIEATIDTELSEPEVSLWNTARITPLSYDQNPDDNVAWAGVNLKAAYLPLVLKGR
jgi:uncharacterized repeat protein (TIGR01451 family)